VCPLASLFIPLAVFAQPASIVHVGYQNPRSVVVAPGQVLHLTLHGLTTDFPATPIAQSFPLPTFFNGLSASLQKSGSSTQEMLPLLRLDTIVSCKLPAGPPAFGPTNTVPCAAQDKTYDLWVQIPFDLTPNTPGEENASCNTPGCTLPTLADAVLTVTETSGPGLNLRVLPVVDQVHILNTCADNLGALAASQGASFYASYACVPAITHANNTFVTGANPARPGEELIAYAYGLGAPPPPFFDILSGTPAAGVALSAPFTLSFPGGSQPAVKPDYVGLVGGNPGLYQINFHLPAVPATLTLCTPPPAPSQLPLVPFNFSMTITGTASVDQASFCVQP
jgi:hypothetical protein